MKKNPFDDEEEETEFDHDEEQVNPGYVPCQCTQCVCDMVVVDDGLCAYCEEAEARGIPCSEVTDEKEEKTEPA